GRARLRARRRVPGRRAARLASRRADLRDRRRRLAPRSRADAVSALSAFARPPPSGVRARPGAAIAVRARRRCALAMAACDLADEGSALFDHVQDAVERRKSRTALAPPTFRCGLLPVPRQSDRLPRYGIVV